MPLKRTSSLLSKLKEFATRDAGNIILTAAVAFPVLVLAAGGAVDVSQYLIAKSQLRNAVDQAALAAVSVDGQDRIAVARRFLDLNLPENVREQVDIQSIDVVDTSAEGSAVAVEVQIEAQLRTTFSAFAGIETLDVSHTSEAKRRVHDVEVVLTLASNGTMCSTKLRSPNRFGAIEGDTIVALRPDPACTNFNAMKEGVQHFVDVMFGNQALSNVKVGLVPYNFKVRFPDTRWVPPSIAAREQRNFYQDVSDATPLSPILSLTGDRVRIETAIDELSQSPAGVAWSRTSLATQVAGLMLDPHQARFFRNEVTPVPFDSEQTEKVIIMMTDGSNIGCCFTNWRQGDFDNQYVYYYEPDNNAQLALCGMLKDHGVTIFSIIFDVEEGDAGGDQINNIFARCASGSYSEAGVSEESSQLLKCRHKQNCYNVATDRELKAVYSDIAQTYFIPRLSQ